MRKLLPSCCRFYDTEKSRRNQATYCQGVKKLLLPFLLDSSEKYILFAFVFLARKSKRLKLKAPRSKITQKNKHAAPRQRAPARATARP